MGIDFYEVSGGRKTKEIWHGSHFAYHFIRRILLSQYNPQAGLLYQEMEELFPEQKDLLDDMESYVPPVLVKFFCSSDERGEWTAEEVGEIVAGLRNGPYLKEGADIRPAWIILPWMARDRIAPRTNEYMNKSEWRQSVRKFVSALEKVAEEGKGVEWN